MVWVCISLGCNPVDVFSDLWKLRTCLRWSGYWIKRTKKKVATCGMWNLNSPKNWSWWDANKKGSASWPPHYSILWMMVGCFSWTWSVYRSTTFKHWLFLRILGNNDVKSASILLSLSKTLQSEWKMVGSSLCGLLGYVYESVLLLVNNLFRRGRKYYY